MLELEFNLFVQAMSTKKRNQFFWMVGLNACGALVHCVLPLLLRLSIYKNAYIRRLGSCNRRGIKVPLIRAEQLWMEESHYFLYVLRIEGLWHDDPIRPQLVNLFQKVSMFRPEHHMISHIVTLDCANQVLGRRIFGVDINTDLSLA